jgi:nicotinate phosphoribosyltransferase
MFHPVHTFVSKFVTNFEAKELQKTIFKNGELIYEQPSLGDIQKSLKHNLSTLWPEYTRTLNPQEYPVDLSDKLWKNKMETIEKVKNDVEEQLKLRENGN